MISLTVGVPCTLVSMALVGGPLAPLTDRILKRKYKEMDNYWTSMLGSCKASPMSRQSSCWLKRQKAALGGGKLCRERAVALHEAGYVTSPGNTATLMPLVEEKARFTFEPTIPARLGYALLAAILPLWLTLSGSADVAIALSVPLVVTLSHIVICDLRSRIIPYQATLVYAAISLAWVSLLDTASLLDNFLLALIAAAILAFTEHCALKLTGASAIGAGDRRLIPIICFQIGLAGLLPGLVALCLVAGTMAIAALVQGRSRRSYLPFAPALFAMAIVGCASAAPSLSGICL